MKMEERPGYRAVVVDTNNGESQCMGCAFEGTGLRGTCGEMLCVPSQRADKKHVRYIEKELHVTYPKVPPLKVYIIGSLRNGAIPEVAEQLRAAGHDAFDSWYSAGPEADDYWQKHERLKGHNFQQALAGAAAQNVYAFDKRHLDASDAVVMVMPAGRSGHLELGYSAGQGKRTFILMDGEPDRYDVMYNFATKVVLSMDELLKELA